MDKNAKEQKITSSWSANDIVLEDFMANYVRTQKLFRLCRRDRLLLIDLFDSMREVYRMERPYLRKSRKEAIIAKYTAIEKEIGNYLNAHENYRKNNFGRIYNMIDALFTELTEEAVDIHFFPTRITERTVEDKARDGMIQR